MREWFARINDYGARRGMHIVHYINSSGLKEIIEGTEIAGEFRKIYACSFLYDVDGIAYWPAVAVNYTNKTQFIFKINKGVESVSDSKEVNRYVPGGGAARAVPAHDLRGRRHHRHPRMRLVKSSGGHSIAVYNPDQKGRAATWRSSSATNRVNHVCPCRLLRGLGDGPAGQDRHRQDRPRLQTRTNGSHPIMKILFATNNAHKLAEVRAVLGDDFTLVTPATAA